VYRKVINPIVSFAISFFGVQPAWAGSAPVSNELTCLAQAIHYEARGESREGMKLVGLVVRARVADPRWPNSYCGVVWQRNPKGCQFSWACERSRAAFRPSKEVMAVAREVYAGKHTFPKGMGCVRYFATTKQSWMGKTMRVGDHIFGC
jgi:spore germination cell wall hydrolase CwlJ-like protein